MQRENRIFIITLFILNIFIQSLVNIFIFNSQSNHQSLKSLTTTNKPYESLQSNSDFLTILTEINNKLDIQTQYLENNLDTNPHSRQNEAAANSPPSEQDEKIMADHKNSLMNDMNRYDVYLPSFLSDPRLKSLPEQDQREILIELTRRIDNGEIDKSRFLPGYKKK